MRHNIHSHDHPTIHLQADVPVQRRSEANQKPRASKTSNMSGGGGSSSLGPDVWKDLLKWYVYGEHCCTGRGWTYRNRCRELY